MTLKNRKLSYRSRCLCLLVLYVLAVYSVRAFVPPPEAVDNRSEWQTIENAALLFDTSWVNDQQERQLEQTIFAAVLQQIAEARGTILLDMFLFNDWQGPVAEQHRALADDVTNALIAARQQFPSRAVIVITDPVNTVYGGIQSTYLQRLSDAGAIVVVTPLELLQDSNPLYSAFWRGLIRPFGNKVNQATVASPFGDFKVSLRSWFALLNFKANHRKLLLTDGAAQMGWQALVSSANPHDGSSAHRNIALQFSGAAAADVLRFEIALLELSTRSKDSSIASAAQKALDAIAKSRSDLVLDTVASLPTDTTQVATSDVNESIRILTEEAILDAVIAAIDACSDGDSVDLLMFYMSHRNIITALDKALARGVEVRIILDANKDAFGRKKNGVPNRPAAAELVAAGASVRWCRTIGEQCHAKAVYTRRDDQHRLLLGSANFTRRNMDNYNLETNVDLRVSGPSELIKQFREHFDQQWLNEDNRTYTDAYDEYADDSWLKAIQYRFMEASGISTF